jgi:hypothetical protein
MSDINEIVSDIEKTAEAVTDKAADAAQGFTGKASAAFNTIADGCSALLDAVLPAADLALDGNWTQAAFTLGAGLSACADSVATATLALLPIAS